MKVLPGSLPRTSERYKTLVHDLGKTLERDVAQSRQYLKTLVGSIKLGPKPEGYLEAELTQSHEGLFQLTHGNVMYIRMVAGTGFEPVTFGL